MFGLETYTNRNADKLVNGLKNAGVPVIDLRENAAAEEMDVKDLFYRTDHHWTVPAGLWASRIMAGGLNEYAGYDIDLSIYGDENFEFRKFENSWLGEQGRKLAGSYIGLDDYTEVKPVFETSFVFKDEEGKTEGTFDDLISENFYETEEDVYTAPSFHYSYALKGGCVNNDVASGKVLMLTDSYDHVTAPFISLAVHELDTLQLRDLDSSFDLRDYIVKNGYDTVIVSYAQFMIGAHDDPLSANYQMFTLE